MGAIRDTLLGYKHQKTENLLKTLEDKVLKNEASEKNSALLTEFSGMGIEDFSNMSSSVKSIFPFQLEFVSPFAYNSTLADDLSILPLLSLSNKSLDFSKYSLEHFRTTFRNNSKSAQKYKQAE